MTNVIIVSHKFLTQPDDDLVLFLNSKKDSNVLHIRHSFSDISDRYSYFDWYKNGKVFSTGRSKDFRNWSELFIYAKEIYFTIKWSWGTHLIWNTYIGMDGLCSLFGIILKFFGRVRKTVYWAIDFVPEKRFTGKYKNKIYHLVNVYSYKHVDEMWDLSSRMVEAREKFLGIKKADYRFHQVVPYGVWIERISKFSYKECERDTLVFMGHLLEKQGVQSIIEIIPEIIKKIPDFRFKIIGGGPFRESLEMLASRLNVLSYCDFKGKIADIKKLEIEVAKSCVAVAPYIKKLDTWSYYADPGKIKTYLACGLPVLLTDIPWNAYDIERAECGKLISEDKNDRLLKLLELMQPEINQKYRENAIRYSMSFDYKHIFKNINI